MPNRMSITGDGMALARRRAMHEDNACMALSKEDHDSNGDATYGAGEPAESVVRKACTKLFTSSK